MNSSSWMNLQRNESYELICAIFDLRASIRARTFISDNNRRNICHRVFIAGKCLIPIIVELTRRYVNRAIEKLVENTLQQRNNPF